MGRIESTQLFSIFNSFIGLNLRFKQCQIDFKKPKNSKYLLLILPKYSKTNKYASKDVGGAW